MLTYVVEAFAVAFGQTVFELRHLRSAIEYWVRLTPE